MASIVDHEDANGDYISNNATIQKVQNNNSTMSAAAASVKEEEPRRSERRRRRCRSRSARVDYKRLAGEVEPVDYYYNDIYNKNNDAKSNETLQHLLLLSHKNDTDISQYYANRHVPHVLHRQFDSTDSVIQIVSDGSTLTASALKSSDCDLTISRPILVTDTPESLGMIVPKPVVAAGAGAVTSNNRYYHFPPLNSAVTVRDVAEIIGVGHAVTVMDVKHQEELDGWTLGDLMDYFEDEDRLKAVGDQKRWLDWLTEMAERERQQQQQQQEVNEDQNEKSALPSSHPPPPPPPLSEQQQQHRVLNQISLEFSNTPLVHQVRSPTFVRELDWIDNIWPSHLKSIGDYPRVQYYCLTSTAGCYTDFHVDFGGTSVWYHILSGQKIFILIPPSECNLKVYEDWLCSQNQNEIFYPDLPNVKGVYRVSLNRGQTLVIPAGYIHAVYTPEDSVVIGGNFLHGLGVEGQLDVHCLETRTRVPAKFRFPHFVRMMFYAGADYIKRMVISSDVRRDKEENNDICEQELRGIDRLADALQSWAVQPGGDADRVGSVAHTARECVDKCGCKDVVGMVNLIKKERLRWLERLSKRNERKIKLFLKNRSDSDDMANSSVAKGNIASDKPTLKLRLNSSSTDDSSAAATVLNPEKTQYEVMKKNNVELTVDLDDRNNEFGNSNKTSSNNVEDDDDIPSDFKIVLPPNPLGNNTSVKSMKRKRTQNTDLDPYHGRNRNDQGDDEWVPGGKKKKKKTKKKEKASPSTMRREAAKIPLGQSALTHDSVQISDARVASQEFPTTLCGPTPEKQSRDGTGKHGTAPFNKKMTGTIKQDKAKAAGVSNYRFSRTVDQVVSRKIKPTSRGMTARERLKKRMGL